MLESRRRTQATFILVYSSKKRAVDANGLNHAAKPGVKLVRNNNSFKLPVKHIFSYKH